MHPFYPVPKIQGKQQEEAIRLIEDYLNTHQIDLEYNFNNLENGGITINNTSGGAEAPGTETEKKVKTINLSDDTKIDFTLEDNTVVSYGLSLNADDQITSVALPDKSIINVIPPKIEVIP